MHELIHEMYAKYALIRSKFVYEIYDIDLKLFCSIAYS